MIPQLHDELGSPVCLYRNCVQFDVPDLVAKITLIDTYTRFEVHIDILPEDADDLCPEEFPVIKKAIDKGLHKAALNLGYFNSSPSSALLCPCGRGEAHVAEIISKSTRWKCTLKGIPVIQAKLTPLQCLLADQLSAASTAECKLLTESYLLKLLEKLNIHACKWRDIGLQLGFLPGELDNIQARPFLMQTAPESWLGAMLTEWLQRAPDDTRGSSSLKSLMHALSKCGIGIINFNIEL